MFSSILFCISFNWNAKNWCVWWSNMDLIVLYAFTPNAVTWTRFEILESESSLVLYTVYCAKTPKYAVHATALRGIVYITVKFTFDHQAHHFSAFQFNEEQSKILLNIIMTSANTCYSWKIFNAVLVWSQVCWASNWSKNGHGEWRLLVSFHGGYCTGYNCLRKTEAWPARNGWYCNIVQSLRIK